MTVQVNVYAAGVSRECREAFEDDLSAREPIPRVLGSCVLLATRRRPLLQKSPREPHSRVLWRKPTLPGSVLR
jgi:hypothetical protein